MNFRAMAVSASFHRFQAGEKVNWDRSERWFHIGFEPAVVVDHAGELLMIEIMLLTDEGITPGYRLTRPEKLFRRFIDFPDLDNAEAVARRQRL